VETPLAKKADLANALSKTLRVELSAALIQILWVMGSKVSYPRIDTCNPSLNISGKIILICTAPMGSNFSGSVAGGLD
jgi:hypothetical protein